MILDFQRLVPAIATMGIALSGCGSPEGGTDQLPVYDITPKVTVDGKPVGGMQLTMSPSDPNARLPNSGVLLDENGTGTFSTYAAGDGIPAGDYKAGLMPDVGTMKPVPQVKPITVTTSEAQDGEELKIEFESTGKTQESILPRRALPNR